MTELVFILDKSGSMSCLEADSIGGFNSMIEKQRRESDQIAARGSAAAPRVLRIVMMPLLISCGCLRTIGPMGSQA